MKPHPTFGPGLAGWRTLSAAHALRDLSCLELFDAANVARHRGDDGAANLLMAVLSARLDVPALGRRS